MKVNVITLILTLPCVAANISNAKGFNSKGIGSFFSGLGSLHRPTEPPKELPKHLLVLNEHPFCRSKNHSYPNNKLEVFGEILKKHVQALRRTANSKVELVFLVDSSGSVGLEEFANELKFVKKLLSDFTVDRHTTRVSVITFSSSSRVVRNIDHLSHPSDDKQKCSLIEEELPKIQYTGGGTYTLGAVQEAQQVFKEARPDAKKAMFVITDGHSNGGDPRPVVEQLKLDGVEVFTFGIRQGNFTELCDMASERKEEHTYILDTFDEFEALARRALHEDLHIGNYIIQNASKCSSLCEERRECCDALSTCQCGTHTGKYECICQAGYYGNGLKQGCLPCPEGTYKNYTGPGDKSSCMSCPDPNHVTPVGSMSVLQCECRRGFKTVPPHACAAMTCPELSLPENGYVVHGQCNNDVNAACGIRCKQGYSLLGSSVRLCTEDGVWTGTDASCEIKRCPRLQAPSKGNMACTKEDFSFETNCHFSCNPGYKLVGSKSQSCLAFAHWSGIPPTCREVKCPELAQLADGKVLPESCTLRESSFGSTCVSICHPGYTLVGPVSKQCQENGKWSPDYGKENICVDVTPPAITCPNDVEVEAAPGERIGEAFWTQPVTSDNSGTFPTVTVVPALIPPVSVPIGINTVMYIAEDNRKNKAKCTFTITVNDVEPPRIDKCISPPPFTRKSEDIKIWWEEPIFSDNSHEPIKVRQSHKPGVFPLGSTLVQYTAMDKYNNNSTCTIEIIVQEHACSDQHVPSNGNLACHAQASGVECSPVCKNGFGFAIRPADKYLCEYNTGVWTPSNSWPVKDCSVSEKSNQVIQSTDMRFKLNKACRDRLLLNQLETSFEKKIKQKVSQYCQPNVVCGVEQFETSCTDEESEDNKRDVDNRTKHGKILITPVEGHNNKRKRRFVDSAIQPALAVRFAREGEAVDETAKSTIAVEFDVTGSIHYAESQDRLSAGVTHVLERIREDALNGEFDSVMSDEDTHVIDLASYKLADPTFVCHQGSVLRDLDCVKCPGGTFFNVVNEACESCLKGTYQPEEGQLTCLVCPNQTSTANNNSKSIQQCKGQCLPGSFSDDGVEWCETCPIGFYQPLYAQLHCLPCPAGTTTWRRGTRLVEDCRAECPPGYVSKTGLEPCLPCLRGYYQAEHGRTSCFQCPGNARTRDKASTDVMDCEGVSESAAAYSSTPTLELDINECFTEPCSNGAKCVSLNASYTCQCLPGWAGIHCETEIDECFSDPCKNNASCVDLFNGFNCTCQPGWMEMTCEVNVDECASMPCQNNASCIDGTDFFACECVDGFNGSLCELNVDDCATNPCKNGGVCVDGITEYKCRCPLGFHGNDCEVNFDECLSAPCHNNGTCFDDVNSFSCLCKSGYTGGQCELNVNECESSPCQHGGTCLDDEARYLCRCAPSYGGQDCQTKLNSSFDLIFPSSGITDYIAIEDPFGENNLTAVTLAVWIKTRDKINQGTILSYATNVYDNALVIMDGNGFVLYVNGKVVVTDVEANDDTWHHIAFTWSSPLGAWHIYKDGTQVANGTGIMPETTVESGGVLVVGQEQDMRGGKFSSSESFVGRMSNLNIWDYALTPEAIGDLSKTCEEYIGNLVAWPDVIVGINGRISQLETLICKGCEPPANISDGYVSWNGTHVNATAWYGCDAGHEIDRTEPRHCQLDTTWSGPSPRCLKVYCGSPVTILHGSTSGSVYSFGSRIHYVCNTGYRLLGNGSLYCNAAAQWEGVKPQCTEITCIIPPLSARLRIQSNKIYRPGDRAHFICSSGFRLNGTKSSKCSAVGHWETPFPHCDEIFCFHPPNVTNGVYIEAASFAVGKIVSYKCDVGYELLQKGVVKCQEDGTWTSYQPICRQITCSVPSYISHGKIIPIASNINDVGIDGSSSFLYGSNIQILCDEGYATNSVRILQCMDTGHWNSTLFPRCIPIFCPTLVISEHLLVTADAPPAYKSVAYFQCYVGYIMAGHSTSVCLETGKWSHPVPSCEPIACPPPSTIQHGTLNGSDFVFNGMISYSCVEGYTLRGDPKRRCDEVGRWSHQEPICVPTVCPALQSIEHGRVIGADYSYNSVLEFTCDAGYALLGSPMLKCLSNSSWHEDPPHCRQVMCHEPTSIHNGRHTGSPPFYPGSVISYNCNQGYEMEGKSTRSCRADGTWTGPIPRCTSIKCLPPVPIEHGRVLADNTSYGSSVEYQCDSGYEPMGPTNRTCSNGNVWTGAEPSCRAVLCSEPEAISNGSIEAESHGVGATVVYRCDAGYKLVGDTERTCREDKTWNSSAPQCIPIECIKPTDVISNGRIIGTKFSYGDSIEYICDVGYFINGVTFRVCNASGLWDSPIPVCERVECSLPMRVENANLDVGDTKFKGKIKYTCKAGYRLIGSDTRICEASGTWTGDEPKCIEIECEALQDVANGKVLVQGLTYKNLAAFSCTKGYLLEGLEFRECSLNGSWSGTEPTCRKMMCGGPPLVDYGIPLNDQVEPGSAAEYSCDEGYQLDGTGKLVCSEFGNFTGDAPSCRKVVCPKPEYILNGNLQARDINLGDTVDYTCDEGYELIGQAKLVCEKSGQWSSSPPTCVRITCRAPDYIPDVIIHSGGYEYGSRIDYSCIEGHKAKSGDAVRTCQANKTWSGHGLVCEKVACPAPRIPYGFVAVSAGDKAIEQHVQNIDRFVYGITVIFDCEEGFLLKGPREFMCQVNGMWNGSFPVCERVKCPPPNISNAILKAPLGFTFGHRTTVLCKIGFELFDPKDLSCLANGSWSEPPNEMPTCQPVSCEGPMPSKYLSIHVLKAPHGNFSFETIIGFVCQEGFELEGPKEITCLSNKRWSGFLPTCKPITCSPPLIEGINLPMFDNTKNFYEYDEKLTFDCSLGSKLVGDRHLFCNEFGAWDGTVPTCQPIECKAPAINNSVNDERKARYPVGFVLTIECEDGYYLIGSSKNLLCLETMIWSGVLPRCQAITCASIKVLNGQIIDSESRLSYRFGEKVGFECELGYAVKGSSLLECLKSGNWSTDSPECAVVTCPALEIDGGTVILREKKSGSQTVLREPNQTVMDKGNVTYRFGDVVEIECFSGYMLATYESTTMCSATGSWSGIVPTCERTVCTKPFVNNAAINTFGATQDDANSTFFFGDLIEFVCNEGYTLIGPAENLCQLDGTWSEDFPVCHIVLCPQLQIGNATVSGNKNATYNSKATVVCLPGFELFGDSELVCKANGLWSALIPVCVKVACKLPSISDAKFMSAKQQTGSFHFGDKLHIECVEGYELDGNAYLTCNANRSWTPVLPRCKIAYCPEPNLNSSHLKHKFKRSGVVTVSNFSFGSEIAFECELGYALDGKDAIKCEANKTWSSKVSSCQTIFCETPFIDNGGFKPSNLKTFTFGNSIRFFCKPGFAIEGETEILCQPDGEWTAKFATCTRLSCPDIPVIPHGRSIGTSMLFEAVVSYSCDSGYEIVRNQNITCLENLQWGTPPSCLPVSCPRHTRVQYGEYVTTGNTYLNTIAYTCNHGYELRGLPILTCLASGSWSGQIPTCEKVNCSYPPYVPHADLIGESFMYQDTLQLRCHEGYRLQGFGVITCQWNQTWSRVQGHCNIISCNEPPVVRFAELVGSGKREYNSTVRYLCIGGYEFAGNLQAAESTCLSSGSWSRVTAECHRIKCPNPALVTNGSLMVDGKSIRSSSELGRQRPNGFYYSDKINYVCDKGFELFGIDVQSCTADAKWNGSTTSCEIVTCPKPPRLFTSQYLVPVARQVFTFGQTVAVECNEGYSQRGSGMILCTVDKEWDTSGVKCERITCPTPEVVPHGIITGSDYSYKSHITYACVEGFQLVGDGDRSCSIHATWTGIVPHCALVHCSKIDTIQNGYIEGSNYSYSSVIVHHCNTGYQMINEARRTCQFNGSWSGRDVVCTIRSCGEAEHVDHGTVATNSTTYGGVAEYRCHLGYEMYGGEKFRRCDQNGKWTGAVPECKIIVCIKPPRLENGYFVGDSYNYVSVVKYYCNQFYYLSGESERRCQADGMWSGTQPVCREKQCPQPSQKLHMKFVGGSFSVGQTIQFQCDEGYRLVGSKALICSDGVSWSEEFPFCEQITCISPPPVNNARFDEEAVYKFGSIVKYICKVGYKLSGSATVRCLNSGQWSDVTASCSLLSCGPTPLVTQARIVERGRLYNDEAYYVCEEGYNLDGNNLLRCSVDGIWSGSLPRCEMISCGVVPVIPFASTIVHKTTFGSKASYECNKGYQLYGSSVVVCRANGSWSYAERPSCKPVDCGRALVAPENGGVHYLNTTFGSTATFYCVEGYYLIGASVIQCGEQGTWKGLRPTCGPVTCPAPSAVINGRYIGTDFKFNQVVTYECSNGYRLGLNSEGFAHSSRVCLSNGTWSGGSSKCELIYCEYPSKPENGYVNVTGLYFGSLAKFWCAMTYDLKGRDSAVCTRDGFWSEPLPACVLSVAPDMHVIHDDNTVRYRSCSALPTVQNTVEVVGNFVAGDTVILDCQKGYQAAGNIEVTCQDDSSWTNSNVHCERISCGHPKVDDPMVIIMGRNYMYGDKVMYVCRQGLIPTTDRILTCQSDGRWDLTPQCQATCKFPCRNGGTCVGTNKCKCLSGYGGRFCDVASCVLPCLNGGQCVAPYTCGCPHGYTGARCETPICEKPCQNGGRCILANRCLCPHGFLPPFCESSRLRR